MLTKFGKLLTSSKLLIKSKPTILLVNTRGIRGAQRIFRSKLPKYQNNLQNLPPLTQLLTSDQEKDALQLREMKLDVYKQYLPRKTNVVLLEAIFSKENDVDRLLRIIDVNLPTMTSFYLGVSFEALDDMMRANLCDTSTVAVSPEFERLCTRTLFRIRFFEADEVLKLIKCLSTLKLPENLLLVQAALQMTRHLINEFNEEELECLGTALEAIESCEKSPKSLLAALKTAKTHLLAQRKAQLMLDTS